MTSRADSIRIYDNGGKSFDRYTAVFMNQPERDGCFAALGMSEEPFHPQGYGMHVSAMPGRHLGRRIRLADLPADCRRFITNEHEEAEGSPPLTADQLARVAAFASAHGRCWKSTLRALWERGTRDAELQHLRNTHGPAWLAGFRLPKEASQ